MMPAQYFCSGEIPKEGWHHYGLAAPVYTHFTSPIRRYADVVVHRLLAAAIGVTATPHYADRGKQQDLSVHLNRRHKAAQYAQRASVSLYTLLYFKDHPSVETGYILSISQENDKLTILAPKFGVETAISIGLLKEQIGAVSVESLDEGNCLIFVDTHAKTLMKLKCFEKVRIHIAVTEGKARR